MDTKTRLMSFRLILVFLIFLGCATEGDKKKAQSFFELGLGLMEEERYPECISHLENAIKMDPSRSDITMHTGICYMKLEKYVEAEKLIREACETEKNFPECWNNLSYLYLKMNRWKDAQTAANKALTIATYRTPDIALANLAFAEIELKQVDSALKNLEKARRFNPSNCMSPMILGRVYILKNEFEEGLRYILSARELCAMNAQVHLWEAYAYYKLGQRENAKEKYREILRVFKRGEAVEYSRLNLEKMRKKIPLEEPPVL